MTDDDDALFQEEDSPNITTLEAETQDRWTVLLVDDDDDIHQVTHFMLNDYTYQNKSLTLLSAYSAEQAKVICQTRTDIAIILLDVVMESHDAGLKLVEYIRDTLNNRFMRIILRTGQPGYAPEKEVILKYEINDYYNKAELTKQRLFTVITTSLRSYIDIITIENYRQQLEQKVAERTAELIQLNQEKNELLSIVAHDLKNPLSAIQGLVDLIESHFVEYTPPPELSEYVRLIDASSQQMFELIKNLLNMSTIESGKLSLSVREVDLKSLSQDVVHYYTNRAKSKNIQLHFSCPEERYLVTGDKVILYQILDNLLSNAIKYSPLGKNVYIQLSKENDSVQWHVQDEGPGLSHTDQQKLFTKFSRLAPRPTGEEHCTGLGLFIVKKLVEALQGEVWCQSQLGQGTTFGIAFKYRSL